jgi:hypothetical protein
LWYGQCCERDERKCCGPEEFDGMRMLQQAHGHLWRANVHAKRQRHERGEVEARNKIKRERSETKAEVEAEGEVDGRHR